MEERLTLDELQEVLLAAQELEFRRMKFQASLKGIDLDDYVEESQEDKLQEMKYKAQAIAEGRSVDAIKFEEIGVQVISEIE